MADFGRKPGTEFTKQPGPASCFPARFYLSVRPRPGVAISRWSYSMTSSGFGP